MHIGICTSFPMNYFGFVESNEAIFSIMTPGFRVVFRKASPLAHTHIPLVSHVSLNVSIFSPSRFNGWEKGEIS